MAVEIVQFLMSKFVDGLEEEDNATIPFSVQFQEIKEDLEKKTGCPMSPATTDLLRESLYDLNDILIECQLLSKKHRNHEQSKRTRFYSLTDLWFLYKTRKRLRTIKRKIETVSAMTDGKTEASPVTAPLHGDIGRWRPVEYDRWTTQTVDKTKVYGMDNQLIEVERMLMGEEKNGFKGIGIVAMGGVGKTVLAQLLFNSQQVRQRYFPRLWVCVSQTINQGKDLRREILERMLMSLGVEEDVITSISRSNSLAELMFALHLQLMGKRYLIVFDDVWNIDEWYEKLDSGLPRDDEWAHHLAFGLPKGSGGGVIVTTRLEEVARRMVGDESLYHLRPLIDEENCWAIFMDSLTRYGPDMSDHPTLRAMKKEILDNCCGLPLAAKAIGEILGASFSSSGDSSRKTSFGDMISLKEVKVLSRPI